MKMKIPYRNIAHTVEMMGKQIEASIDFANDFVPIDTDPKELFWILRQNTTYKNDPPGVELLQSMPSMFEDNYWGIPGAGDCDCFTISAVACCLVADIPCRIVIVGNNSEAPSHVYAEVLDNGKWTPFDLVNPYYGQTKPYAFKKIINVY
ncbi:MAG: hypothetical protein EBT51_08720 [Flavobacteriaceae bacterium]|nr:hypothetical protein [Flavobacteriaceae bacterium]